MMYLYFYLISFSLIGYGLIVRKMIKIETSNFGLLGLLGLTFLSLISYSSSLILKHGILFNSLIISFGILIFLINLKKIYKLKKELIFHFIIFFILLLFISVAKNHDDFPYYHFPYTILLTEFSHPIGIGQLNNGFRSPSSIFFLSSMFYLPKIGFYLFHTTPAFILGFANLILLNNIFDQKIFNKIKIANFLSLFCFVFINIFFYRLAEHGTDRSGMILVLLSIIYLIVLVKDNSTNNNDKDLSKLKIFSILLCFTISLKPYYLIYLPLFVILLFYQNTRKNFLKLWFSPVFFYCLFFLIFTIFYTFINSGCLAFPLIFTCFENLPWSIEKKYIYEIKVLFEWWSKGGTDLSNGINERISYIQGFNWLPNWIDIYFFNKVSDFLLGLVFISLVFYFIFKPKLILKNLKDNQITTIYLFLVIVLFEWFLKHPILRYGGYHIVALLFFIPISLFLSKSDVEYKDYFKKTVILILITSFIFIARNINRLSDEYRQYQYNVFVDTNYRFIGGNKKAYFRYNKKIKDNIENYNTINIFGKNFLNTTFNK